MYLIIRFIFGLAVGSFLNVLVTRYDPDRFLLTKKTLGGRSHCPYCREKLHWYELIPVFSFIIQLGRCRNCGKPISLLYPIGELASAFILAFVPAKIAELGYPGASFILQKSILWVLIFLTLQLLAFIDYRLSIIPDEGGAFLFVLGLIGTFLYPLKDLGSKVFSFIGHYAYLFGFQDKIWLNHILGAVIAIIFFGILILITKGKGMGFGDLKLSFALGMVFGWPDTALLIGSAFIIGAVAGIYLLAFRLKKMKGAVPFVPFLFAGAATVFFFGYELTNAYFSLLHL